MAKSVKNPTNKGNNSRLRRADNKTNPFFREVGRSVIIADRDFTSGSFVSLDDARTIATLDLQKAGVSDDPTYAAANVWQYYTAINLWLCIIIDVHRSQGLDGMREVTLMREYIRTYGLIFAIRRSVDLAQSIVAECEDSTNEVRFAVDRLSDIQPRLQVLRFLKRFTPLKTNLLFDQALKDWLSVEKVNKRLQLRCHTQNSRYVMVLRMVRHCLSSWTAKYVPVRQWLSADPTRIVVPAGATFERIDGKSPDALWRWLHAAELLRANRIRYHYNSTPFTGEHAPDEEALPSSPDAWWGRTQGRPHTSPKRFNRLILVPKTYKGPRIVCPETVRNQILQRAIRDQLEAIMPRWVKQSLPLRDQSVMEQAARNAWRDRTTTTDLSHASDSFLLTVAVDAYGPIVGSDILSTRPTHTVLPDGSHHVLQQCSTMGTGDVWLLMAGFLLACMRVACDLEAVSPSRKRLCLAFGDDCIHPDEIADTFYWILTMFGFTVNVDKSFGGDSRYRESCGSEWWKEEDGVSDITTLYYPRFPVSVRNGSPVLANRWRHFDTRKGEVLVTDTLERFVALQHHVFLHGYTTASDFLTNVIMRLEPRMTTSTDPSAPDLLGYFERPAGWKDCRTSGPVTVEWPTCVGMQPASRRSGHLRPVTTARALTGELVQEILYETFLRQGPKRHSDPWLALMGCTEPRTIVDTDTTTVWKVVYDG